MKGSKSLNKRRVNAHCLAPIKTLGLVHVRRREKRDRKIVGINIGLFLPGDQTQNFFDLKGTTNKDVFFVECL